MFPPEERKRVLRKHTLRWRPLLALWLPQLIGGLLPALVFLLINLRGGLSFSVPESVIVLMILIPYGVFGFVGLQLHMRAVRRSIRRAMPEFCVKCGYCLVGLKDPRCPECGTPFDPLIPRSQERMEEMFSTRPQ
jgi:hypothetical protein